MHIRYLNATFGRLEHSELTLQPGLNVIYAPNEAGKSTWSRFIRDMFYGVDTRSRGALADKNRYAPWSGAPMEGRMDIQTDDKLLTLLRQSRRGGAPMGDFSCTYAGTDTPVPGITGQNAGEKLLGIPEEIFDRSAFIAHAALSVDQDAELERRIAALITTGEEGASYSETIERLRRQLHRRRRGKTGLIPALEREIGESEDALHRLEALQAQHRRTAEDLERLCLREAQLEEQRRQWELLGRAQQLEEYRAAQREADQIRGHLADLTDSVGPLPDEARLARLENRCDALRRSRQTAEAAKGEAEQAAAEAARLEELCSRHPLYPADEAGLRDRMERTSLPEAPSPLLSRLGLMATLCGAAAAAACALLRLPAATLLCTAGWTILWALWTGIASVRRRRSVARRSDAEAERALLARQMEEYLPLRAQCREAIHRAARAQGTYSAAAAQQAEEGNALLLELAAYRPATDLNEAALAVQELRRQRDALADLTQAARDAAMRCSLLEARLPEGAAPPVHTPTARPTAGREDIRQELTRLSGEIQATRSRLDTLAGQIRFAGDPDDLINRLRQKREHLERLQAEYDAIAMAMDAAEGAHLTLQNRFSPALGKRAAEIFSGITGGKYRQVLLGRDFSVSAEAAEDPVRRSVHLLSRGAADQLYLSVRLAICDLVLPREASVPLILDDALLAFDDKRLHAALSYLLEESRRRQILLFTCQQREQVYLAGRENVTLFRL